MLSQQYEPQWACKKDTEEAKTDKPSFVDEALKDEQGSTGKRKRSSDTNSCSPPSTPITKTASPASSSCYESGDQAAPCKKTRFEDVDGAQGSALARRACVSITDSTPVVPITIHSPAWLTRHRAQMEQRSGIIQVARISDAVREVPLIYGDAATPSNPPHSSASPSLRRQASSAGHRPSSPRPRRRSNRPPSQLQLSSPGGLSLQRTSAASSPRSTYWDTQGCASSPPQPFLCFPPPVDLYSPPAYAGAARHVAPPYSPYHAVVMPLPPPPVSHAQGDPHAWRRPAWYAQPVPRPSVQQRSSQYNQAALRRAEYARSRTRQHSRTRPGHRAGRRLSQAGLVHPPVRVFLDAGDAESDRMQRDTTTVEPDEEGAL